MFLSYQQIHVVKNKLILCPNLKDPERGIIMLFNCKIFVEVNEILNERNFEEFMDIIDIETLRTVIQWFGFSTLSTNG